MRRATCRRATTFPNAAVAGEFERGWREYRYRYSLAHTTAIERKVQRPRWNGQAIPGKTLLIHDEQGFGDTFQFMRMVPWAKQKSGARVVLEVNAETYSLAQRTAGFDEVVVRGALPPPFDLHCEMMSLPMIMGLRLEDLPGAMPYMSADPERVARWRERLAGLPRPLVALVWAGRPTHANDKNRSMSLAQLAPLASSGATFVAIQKGPAAAQAAEPPEGMSVVSLSDEIADFEDTAAILSVVDLLIRWIRRRCILPGRWAAGVGDAAVRARLALAARAQRYAVVSVDAFVPAGHARRLGWGDSRHGAGSGGVVGWVSGGAAE